MLDSDKETLDDALSGILNWFGLTFSLWHKVAIVLIVTAAFIALAVHWGYHAELKSGMVGAAGVLSETYPAKPVVLWRRQLAMQDGHDAYGEIFNHYVKR